MYDVWQNSQSSLDVDFKDLKGSQSDRCRACVPCPRIQSTTLRDFGFILDSTGAASTLSGPYLFVPFWLWPTSGKLSTQRMIGPE